MMSHALGSSTLAGHHTHSSMQRPTLVCHARQTPTARFGAAHSQLLGSRLGSHSFAGTQLKVSTPTSRQVACGATGVQANLFSRFFRVIRSYANSVVSGAEDPEKMLDQAVNEMQNDLVRLRQASAQVIASQRQLEAKYSQAKDTSDQWYRRAQLALEKGDEGLAREALSRRKGYDDNAKTMKVQLDAQVKAVDQLKGNTRMLENKLSEAKSKKDTLKARAKSASTSKQINEMLQGLNTSSASSAFDRMEEKVMALEGESDAAMQLSTSDELEGKFARLEGDDVDAELSAMKKGMLGNGGSSKSKQSLPEGRSEGRPYKDAIDWELEELRRKARD
ncbi:TPA: hypothetical protein ACH3X2_000137 [Trebouxia sp. C0005]|nr:MAG: Plastid transcriptionally active 4 [Trebouxia sp. A1-2]